MRLPLSASLIAGISTAAMAQVLATDEETFGAMGQAMEAGEIVSLTDWDNESLYTEGWSVENFIDEMDVVDATGETIGDVEDVIFGASGQILSVVAEIGGFIDIGDTHVSIPWDQVTIEGDNVLVPLTEENLEDYDYFTYAGLAGGALSEDIVRGVDDVDPGARAWRASELIGDYARIRGEDTFLNYGYVTDILVRDGEIAATVVDPGIGYGRGYYAYPYYGYGRWGWGPGYGYYDMPYTVEEVGEIEPLEYDRFDRD